MQYMIIEKWQLQGIKPRYDIKVVIDDLLEADKKMDAYRLINTDKKQTYFIVPFDESILLLSKIAS
jgi:hypothetical protein|tara:strand:+ start:814 stop:1011 length:198 start_codon:yes stop_codon:yes gene_type:complete